MLEATSIELQMESLELNTLFRSGVMSSLEPTAIQQAVDDTQKNIRLANELRSFYFEEQNKVRRLSRDTKVQQRMFQTLDRAGLLEKIMKVPI